jgi:hypothetical protein
VLLVRPEDLDLVDRAAPEGSSATPPPLHGRVRDRRFRGETFLYRVEIEGASAAASAKGRARAGEGLLEVVARTGDVAVGAVVRIRPKSGARLYLFPERST